MNQTILDCCINFSSIDSFQFNDDVYSKQLVDYYKSIVLETKKLSSTKIKKIKEFDSIMYRYVHDLNFREKFKQEITKFKVEKILEFADNYYEKSIKNFESTIWI